MGRKQTGGRQCLLFYIACSLLIFSTTDGCLFLRRHDIKTDIQNHLNRAAELTKQGHYLQAMSEQEKALKLSPDGPPGDQVLYEMGLLLIDSRNRDQDLNKSLEIFKQLIQKFPYSVYREKTIVWCDVLTRYIELSSRLKENESEISELRNKLRARERIIQALREQQKKMKKIDFELNKKRELSSPGEKQNGR